MQLEECELQGEETKKRSEFSRSNSGKPKQKKYLFDFFLSKQSDLEGLEKK